MSARGAAAARRRCVVRHCAGVARRGGLCAFHATLNAGGPPKRTFNLAYRPESYWAVSQLTSIVLANVKGEPRKRVALDSIRSGDPEQVTPDLLVETLDEPMLIAAGRVDPHLMGGEYLPDFRPGEVEIARVTLDSTTMDVIGIRARRQGSAIRYRVVNEYESVFRCTPDRTAAPLSMRELIALIDGCEDTTNGTRGLTDTYRDYNWAILREDDSEYRREELRTFVTVSSMFYPELSAHYEAEADRWVRARRQRRKEEAGRCRRRRGARPT